MYDIDCKFHLDPESPWHEVDNALDALRPYARWLGERDPTLKRWWLGGDTLEEAQRYEAFADGVNGHTATKAVLAAEFKGNRDPVVYLWNGEEDDAKAASLVMSVRTGRYVSDIKFSPSGPIAGSVLGDYGQVAAFVALLASDTNAECCFVYNRTGYGKRMTFADRPGVGWMLYLPRVFTPADLPEARALIPVTKDMKQMGTIIVSITEGVFDYRKPEHLEIARSIETRLVSNDWLPTWTQMMRAA